MTDTPYQVSDSMKRDFVLSHVAAGMSLQDGLIDIWQKVLTNYLQYDDELQVRSTRFPTSDTNDGLNRRRRPRFGETRKVIDTYQSKLIIALFAENYIAANKVGREDAKAARTVTDLLRYSFSREGQYRALSGGILNSLLFGTGPMQLEWNSLVRPGVEVSVDVDANGFEIPIYREVEQTLVNDAQLRCLDIMHFFPQAGVDNLLEMDGVAKYIKMRADKIMYLVDRGVYDREPARRAIASGMASNSTRTLRDQFDRLYRPERPTVDYTGQPGPGLHDGFIQVDGYEYYGEVPWQCHDSVHRWRIITILGNEIVRDIPWPFRQPSFRLPFYDFKINHISGRFYGISPGEGIRYNQEYIDFLGLMLADSVLRAVHPPMLFDIKDTEFNLSKAKAWRPDAWLPSKFPEKVGAMSYGANFGAGMAEFANIKRSIQEDSGALGSIQGQGFGINRASATEIQQTAQFALDRPEMYARYIENESLPPMGQGLFTLYKQGFLEMFEGDPTEELKKRVGERPEPVYLSEIMGEFDIRFVGTRNYQSLMKRMANVSNLIAVASSIPQLANRIDWVELGVQVLEGFGFDTLSQDLDDPQVMFDNLLMQKFTSQAQGMNGNGNGEIPASNDAVSMAQGAGMALPAGIG